MTFPGAYREEERNTFHSSNVYTGLWLQKKEIGEKLLYGSEEYKKDSASYDSSTVMTYDSFLKNNIKFISYAE